MQFKIFQLLILKYFKLLRYFRWLGERMQIDFTKFSKNFSNKAKKNQIRK